jgi:hypothetical protein
MGDFAGIVSLTLSTPRVRLAGMKPRRVVILAVPGLPSRDAVAPFEVFAAATRAAGDKTPA